MRLGLLSFFSLYCLLLWSADLYPLQGLPVLPSDCEAPFAYFYGNELDDFGGSTIATDGTFLYIGGRQNEKAIVSKLRLDGQLVWTRSLELSSFVSQIIDLKVDRDGYLIGCGHTNPSNSLVDISSFAFKLDPAVGDVVWTQVYAEENSLFFLAHDLLDRAAGEPYVLLGNAQHNGPLNTGCDATFYTIDRNDGTLRGPDWHYNLGNCETFTAGVAIDGLIYATGRFNFSNTGFERMRPAVMSMDGQGNPIWSRLYLEDINREARLFSSHIIRDGNDHLVVAAHGDEDGTSVYSNDAWLIRTTRIGRAQWARKFTFPEPVRSEEVITLGGAGYLLLASAPGQNRLYLSRIDALGQHLWSRRIDEVTVTHPANEMLLMGGQVYLTTTLRDGDRQRLALFRFQIENGALPLDCIPSDTLSPTLTTNSTPYNGFNAVTPYEAVPTLTTSMLVDFTDMEALDQSCLPDCEFTEICDNNEDDDGDGLTDCDDPDLVDDCCCYTPPVLDLGPDRQRCDGRPIDLALSEEYTTIRWSTGDTSRLLTLSSSGSYSVTVSDRCDNVQSDTLNLVIGQQVETNETRQICPGETIDVFGQSQGEAGDYTMRFLLASGCDSIHTITIEVLPTITTTDSQTICRGDSMLIFGVMRSEAGTYSEAYTGSNGCDSIHTVDLAVLEHVFSTELQTICAGDSELIFGEAQTEAGTYARTFENAASSGCDSTHTIELQVLEPIITTETRRLCSGDSTNIFGNFESAPGRYTASFTSTAGCDSVHQVQLIVAEAVVTTDTLPVQCAGSSIELFGRTVSESGIYQAVFTGSNGCDSTQRVRVIFDEPIVGRDTVYTCSGESVDIFGQLRSTPGDYSADFTAANGCDSTHITSLLEETLTASFNVFPNCPSTAPGFIVYVRTHGNGGPYSVSWNGRTFYDNTLQPVPPGEHVAIVTSASGCIYELPFTVDDPRDNWWWSLQREPTCTDPKGGSIAVANYFPGLSYSLNGQDFSDEALIPNLEAGSYPITLQYGDGCTLSDTLKVPGPKLPVVKLPADRTIAPGESTRIVPLQEQDASYTYRWSPDQTLDCKDCYKVFARPPKDTEYELVVTNAEGCQNSDRIWILVKEPQPFFIPNIFSPNRDGRNDYFTVFGGDEVREVKEMIVFDRWGEQVFYAQDFPPNVEQMGWDGNFRKRLAPVGTYAYFMRIELADGSTVQVKGAVNLIK